MIASLGVAIAAIVVIVVADMGGGQTLLRINPVFELMD
jgi:hypothetical protein